MARPTLLQMTQDILNSMSSDEVNSISDTSESLQVANIIKNKYYDIISRGDLDRQCELFQLNPSNDATAPVLMFIPDTVSEVKWIKYFDSNIHDGASLQSSQFGAFSHDLNTDLTSSTSWITSSTSSVTIGTGTKTFTVASSSLTITVGQQAIAISGTSSMTGTVTSYVGTTLVLNITKTTGSGTFTTWTLQNSTSSSAPGYLYVTILPLDQFMDYINRFNPSDTDVASLTFSDQASNFTFYFKNSRQPQFCTILSNSSVIFDTYDITQDSTLQASKTMCYGETITPFTLSDSFIPDIDDSQFPLLLNEAKSLAFYELKQMPHQKADQEIKRQWSVLQKRRSISDKPSHFDQLANFGRTPRTGGYSGGRLGFNHSFSPY